MNFFPLVFGCLFLCLGGIVFCVLHHDFMGAFLCGLGVISYLLGFLDRHL